MSDVEQTAKNSEEEKLQFLLFSVDNRGLFGINISVVNEIRERMAVTRSPMTPPEIKGLVSLRGKVLSVIDLATRFCLSVEQQGNRMIVVRVGEYMYGLDVFEVYKIVSANPNQLFKMRDFMMVNAYSCIDTILKLDDDKLVSIIDPTRVIDMDLIRGLDLELAGEYHEQ